MSKITNSKLYDLEGRTLEFAKRVRRLIKKLPKTISNLEDSKQLVRSSGSIGANYIEANHALSKKDFAHRIKISRKEARESSFWLDLLDVTNNSTLEAERQSLAQEAIELVKIFTSIAQKSS